MRAAVKRAAAAAFLLPLQGCSLFTPKLPSLPGTSGGAPMTQPGAGVVSQSLNIVQPENLWRFGWLSIVLVLFFPQIRQPLVNLWTSIFRAMAVPFLLIRDKYESKKDV